MTEIFVFAVIIDIIMMYLKIRLLYLSILIKHNLITSKSIIRLLNQIISRYSSNGDDKGLKPVCL